MNLKKAISVVMIGTMIGTLAAGTATTTTYAADTIKIGWLAPLTGTAAENGQQVILEQVHKEVSVPLVLHGASGIGDEDIKKAISLGIAKINIHTELCQAAMEAINAHKDEPFLAVEREVRKAVKERAMYKIHLFGDAGRADE